MLYFPEPHELREWVIATVDIGISREYFPDIDGTWAEVLYANFALTRLHPDNNNLPRAAARIFYRVIKNHHFTDGNKRSAVLCTYFFVLVNRCRMSIPADELYEIARRVAASSEKQEAIIDMLADDFVRYITPR